MSTRENRFSVPSKKSDILSDITKFHEKFGLSYNGPSRFLPEDIRRFRIKFMQEEIAEYEHAVNEGDLAGQADALIDLVYVAMGTMYLHGFDAGGMWHEVHSKNMQKKRAKKTGEDSKRGSEYDVVKPQGWTPPDITSILDVRNNKGLIVLEGPDHCGKSTLAQYIVDKTGAYYAHLEYNENIDVNLPGVYSALLEHWLKMSKWQLVVIDRFMLSEMVYGSIYRNGYWDSECTGLLHKMMRQDNVKLVHCSPNNPNNFIGRWKTALKKENRQELYTDRPIEVYNGYEERFNMLVEPFGDKIVRHDYTEKGCLKDTFKKLGLVYRK